MQQQQWQQPLRGQQQRLQPELALQPAELQAWAAQRLQRWPLPAPAPAQPLLRPLQLQCHSLQPWQQRLQQRLQLQALQERAAAPAAGH
jgi:hypothetical protein